MVPGLMESSLVLRGLRALVQDRLSAAVDEMFVDVQKTLSEYEQEIRRQRRLLELLVSERGPTRGAEEGHRGPTRRAEEGHRGPGEEGHRGPGEEGHRGPGEEGHRGPGEEGHRGPGEEGHRGPGEENKPGTSKGPSGTVGPVGPVTVKSEEPDQDPDLDLQIQVHPPVQPQNRGQVPGLHQVQEQNGHLHKEEPVENEMEMDSGLDLDYNRILQLVQDSEDSPDLNQDLREPGLNQVCAAFRDQEESSLSSAQSGLQNDLDFLEDHSALGSSSLTPPPTAPGPSLSSPSLSSSLSSSLAPSLSSPSLSSPSLSSPLSSLSSSLSSSSWLQTFRIPWERVPPSLARSMARGERAEAADRRALVRVVVDSMRVHCPSPTRSMCEEVAKRIVGRSPRTFCDLTDQGRILGPGHFTLLNQIKTRIDNLNRGLRLLRKRRVKIANVTRTEPGLHQD